MKVEVRVITPSEAKRMMATNIDNNRSVRWSKVDKIARDLSSGNWRLTGDCIRFNEDDQLIDGQHRLLACIKSCVPLITYVATGVRNDAVYVIDCNTPRSFRDAERILGSDATLCSSRSAALVRGISELIATGNNVTVQEVLSNYEVHDLVCKYYHLCRFANAYAMGITGNKHIMLAIMVMLSNGYPRKKIKAFMDCINRGEVNTDITGVRWKVANDFRTSYENKSFNPDSGTRKYSRILFAECLKAIHCFCCNLSRTNKEVNFNVTEEDFLALNEYFSKFESFKDGWWK